MSAPSPGEWTLGDANCGGGVNLRAIVTTLDGDREELVIGWTSRVVRGGEVIVSDEEAKANALVMGAAKDMLAMLKKNAEFIRDQYGVSEDLVELESLIDRAEGRS